AESLDLALGLALLGGCSEALRDGPAIHLVGQSRVRPVTGVACPMTMATRITTATTGSSDRPGAKIFQIRNLPQDCGPLLLQMAERFGHSAPHLPSVSYTLGLVAQKKKPAESSLSCRTPHTFLRELRDWLLKYPHIYQLLTKRIDRAAAWPGPWPDH